MRKKTAQCTNLNRKIDKGQTKSRKDTTFSYFMPYHQFVSFFMLSLQTKLHNLSLFMNYSLHRSLKLICFVTIKLQFTLLPDGDVNMLVERWERSEERINEFFLFLKKLNSNLLQCPYKILIETKKTIEFLIQFFLCRLLICSNQKRGENMLTNTNTHILCLHWFMLSTLIHWLN